MTKTTKKLLLAALLTAFMAAPGEGATFSVDGIYYTPLGDTSTEVAVVNPDPSSTSPYWGVLTIPSTVTYEGKVYTVTEVGTHCFKGSALLALALPPTIRRMAPYSIVLCDDLESLNLPDNVDTLEPNTVFNCSELTQIALPANLKVIKESALKMLPLSTLTIPAKVEKIEGNAFENCNSLTTLVVDAANPHFSFQDGYLCSKDGKTLVLSLPGDKREELELPSTVTTLGDKAFYARVTLKSAKIPDQVTAIGNGTFHQCSQVTEISIGNGVRSIGPLAFAMMSGCKSVAMGNSVVSIGRSAFNSCGSSTGCGELTLPAGLRTIAPMAFMNSTFTGLTMGDGLEVVDTMVFYGMTRLKRVNLSPTVTEIRKEAFSKCQVLDSIYLHSALRVIGEAAFTSCNTLRSIRLPRNLEVIHNRAFYIMLQNIYVDCPTPPTFTYDGASTLTTFLPMSYNTAKLRVPEGTLEAYKAATVWKNFKNITDDVTLSVDGVETDNGTLAIVESGALKIAGPQRTPVDVYSLSGMKVWSGTAPATITTLNPGIYVVRAGEKTIKVRI